jgi:copper(I)-binding protein
MWCAQAQTGGSLSRGRDSAASCRVEIRPRRDYLEDQPEQKDVSMKFPRLAVTLILATLVAAPALAGSVIQVMHPWARPTIPNRPGVAYFGVHNMGDAPDRLIGARAGRVGKIEIHEAMQQGGVMSMAPVDAVEIPAGGMAHLGPGGLHLMMFAIDPPLKEGDTLEMVLIFEAAGEVAITVPVSKTMGDPQHHGEGHQHGATGN